MNLIAPRRDFLDAMRKLCSQYGSVLIFDEVMTGFRVGLGSAQGLYGLTPDLSTFGKVVGGGMPLGAFGGRREIMEKIAPLGPVYQAGTLSGKSAVGRKRAWKRYERFRRRVSTTCWRARRRRWSPGSRRRLSARA